MKTTLYFATVVAVLFSLGFAAQSTYGQTTGTRVAVIDIQYIFKNHDGFKAQVEQVQKDINEFRRWVAEEQQKIRTEQNRLQTFKTGSTEYKKTEEDIAKMQMTLRLEGAKRERDFFEREAKAYYDVYKKIEAAVADFALRNEIGLVLRFNGEDIDPTDRKSIMGSVVSRTVVYQSRLDITTIILDQYLNRTTPAPTGPGEQARRGPPVPPR